MYREETSSPASGADYTGQWQGRVHLVPRRWQSNEEYATGVVVWYKGSYWRCEGDHTSAGRGEGSPDVNLHLWTPIHSTSSYSTTESPQLSTPSTGSDLQIHNPLPRRQHGSASSGDTRSDKDDSPDSQSTVTPKSRSKHHNKDSKRQGEESIMNGMGGGQGGENSDEHSHHGGAAGFFAAKAEEGLRFLASKQDKTRASQEAELRAEVRGERVWRTGGVGIWAYDGAGSADEVKAAIWRKEGQAAGREGWLKCARARTEFYEHGSGIKPLVQWRLHTPQSGHFPAFALPIGMEGNGLPLYAARAWYQGGLHIGKAGPHLFSGASISYAGAEVSLDTFEVLCGAATGGGHQQQSDGLLKWMMFRHGETCGVTGWQPVEGGREASGEILLVSKGEWDGGQHPGKCRIGDDHAHVPWGGGEVWVRPFQVLAYASATRR